MDPSESTSANSNKIVKGYQTIDFSSAEKEEPFEVYATDVAVIPSQGTHDTGSSKVKLHNMVDYTWEERFYTGQLLAVHMSGVYIAYGLKAARQRADSVRVANRNTDLRTLIKGFSGAVQDISFSHIPDEVVLACVDMAGNLLIHKVLEENQPIPYLSCELILHIEPDETYIPQLGDFYRVIWCPYILDLPDSEEEELDPIEDVCWLLALSRGKKVELWNVKMVTDGNESKKVKPGQVESGYLEITEHTKPIVDAAFSPDGTAIATASLDGDVKFFQVYMQNGKKPRCLHQWKPHRGEPVSSLFFLDNHKNYNPEIQFWKFAITGANNNSELKVWSCESWTCLQTLAFQVSPDTQLKLNAGLDLTSGFLVLSDFHHKILYVLQLYTNSETSAAIISISEFLLPYTILSFGIVDAGLQRFKSDRLEELCEDKNDEEGTPGILVKMYLVQPKSLQDCQIAYLPPKPGSVNRTELLRQEKHTYHDNLTDLNVNITNGDLNSPNQNLKELPANHCSLQLNLMTPDAFNSPVKHDSSGSSLINKSVNEEASYSTSTTLVASPHSLDETDNNLLTGGAEGAIAMGFASGGSSPSREVQEILGEGKCFYQETDDIQPEQEQVTPPEQKTDSAVWPEIPMLRATEVRKNEEQARRSVIQGDCSGGGGDNELWKVNQRLENSVSTMIHAMNSVLEAFEEQAAEVKLLRKEIHQLNLLREIEKIMTRNSQTQTLHLENVLASKDNTQQHEALAANISQSVISFLSTQFLDSVNKEITKTVVPTVMNQMEALKHQVHIELTQKLSTTDHLLKENISKLVHSKSVMDVLSTAIVSSITPVITQCYKEYFSSVALPGFEKSCNTMFSQINDIFAKGSKEFVVNLDAQTRRVLEKNNDQSAQLQAVAEMLKTSTNQMGMDLKKNVASIEKNILEAVTRALTLQQATLEGSVIAAVRSRAVTPAPHVIDTQLQQTQLLQLISQGQVNTAFQQALSASDLGLVVFICENVNPQQLFSQVPCPLQQHVLLSLVQQLSADMNNNTEIKHKYLEEALMNLDINNSVTREHLPAVLSNLQRQLQLYISSNPNNRITRSLKLLMMASQSLLSSTKPH
ncbi:enhancer of mRNA-decapping protein 4 [Macrosteles quadrilineatus]|uniref:enhancer of mRNA-decapping protein 4 n=1 Tax=Macrosteles quadrilineatus TaxID=74068 RepID=UPI0023E23957|nr:enhancer of mRNA-decapping protein 4 [Macrosteles quadrilineatus]